MNGRASSTALLRAIHALVPGADISIIHERPWHSLIFCGTQICLSMNVTNPTTQDCVETLSSLLAEYEFHLPGQIVADIAVTQTVVADGAHCLIIDALLLDD